MTGLRRSTSAIACAAIGMSVGMSVSASLAHAEPSTPVSYPVGATATRYTGPAFDTCTAPSRATLAAWKASPYRAVGIYIGGFRACKQPELTASWVTDVSRQGWRLLPIYVGRQAPCGADPNDPVIDPALAAAQGTAAAKDAVAKAKVLGILPGSAIYDDMEHYSGSSTACRTAVLKFLSGWTKELHRQGYLSGVYAHVSSGAKHLADSYTSSSYARPDALWIARWDGSTSLTGWPNVPNARWAVHQRAKQYTGNARETHGGVRLTIDNDQLDAPVATVAHPYKVTAAGLNARTGPGTAHPVVRAHPGRATVKIVCQAPGEKVHTSSVWDKLSDGTYVSDYYISTPSKTAFSSPLPRCTYPYQVTASGGLNARSGPATSYAVKGALPTGGLAWVVCQRTGSAVSSTRVWDALDSGLWVSDYYVATPSNTTYSAPVPRC